MAYYNYNYYHNITEAKKYYQKAIDFAKLSNTTQSGYYWSSLIALGKIAASEEDYDQAIEYYKQVLDDAERKSSQHTEAKKLLAEAKKARRKKR